MRTILRDLVGPQLRCDNKGPLKKKKLTKIRGKSYTADLFSRAGPSTGIGKDAQDY